ncbi:MAG: SagB family peptide dehydrogenase [Deltaproteobacteria bacterium]|nr:SagB family peptide dehydrogenase [Deltaproteobacteria bacterium]
MSQYHRDTAYHRQSLGGHYLDWSQQPSPFKYYRHHEPQALPTPTLPRAAFWDLALGWPPPPFEQAGPLDAGALAALLLLAAGVTSRAAQGPLGGLRAAASAGALYPGELYFLATELPGLADGLWHFAPEKPGLHLLWPGRLATHAAAAIGHQPARLTFVLSAIYWRSLWKYRTRAYRYCLLDTGHMLANLELAAAAFGQVPRSTADFYDRPLSVLLGLAAEDEAPLVAVSVGETPQDPGPVSAGLPPLDREPQPLSAKTGRDPAILGVHQAGEMAEDAPRSLVPWDAQPLAALPEGAIPLPPPQGSGVGLLEVVRSRRSRRNFLDQPLSLDQLAALLAAALPSPGPVRAMALVHGGGEVPDGLFEYLPGRHALAPRAPREDLRPRLAEACLSQRWVGQAALCLTLWADLDGLAAAGGPRRYRHAMLAAGRAGERLYLAATALGLGCCGVGAFYDQEAAWASRLPAGADPLYVLAAGPVKGWPVKG